MAAPSQKSSSLAGMRVTSPFAATAATSTGSAASDSSVKGSSPKKSPQQRFTHLTAVGLDNGDRKYMDAIDEHPATCPSPSVQHHYTTITGSKSAAAPDLTTEFNLLPSDLIEAAVALATVQSKKFNAKFLESYLQSSAISPATLFSTGFQQLPSDLDTFEDLALPNETTRFKIHGAKSLYYNANYVFNSSAIAAASPTEENAGIFWMGLVLGGNTSLIVTLDDSFFWPRCGITHAFEEFNTEVVCTSENLNIVHGYHIVERKFNLQYAPNVSQTITKTIKQFHLMGWQDKDIVPKEVLASLIQTVYGHSSQIDAPILVHCQNGTGPTGTFLATYEAYRKMMKSSVSPNIFTIASTLRHYKTGRNGCIRSINQYKLVYHTFDQLKATNGRSSAVQSAYGGVFLGLPNSAATTTTSTAATKY